MRAAIAIGLLALAMTTQAASAATLFGLVDTGELFASVDQGANWTVRAAVPVHDGVALGAGATAAQLYLAARSGSIYRSTDAGFTWTATGALATSNVVDLLVRADLSLLVLTATGEVWRSTDQGATFTPLASLPAPDFVSLTQTKPSQRLYATTRSGSVYESGNGGGIWIARGTLNASNLVAARGAGATLHALTETGDSYRSTDAGASWTAVGTLSQVGATALARDGSTLIASIGTGEVASSLDGAAWSWRGAVQQLTLAALGVDSPATTGVEDGSDGNTIAMSAPWPNPARLGHGFTVAFRLPKPSSVTLRLHDVAGRVVAARTAEWWPAGDHAIRWAPRAEATGLYFLRLAIDGAPAAHARLVLAR